MLDYYAMHYVSVLGILKIKSVLYHNKIFVKRKDLSISMKIKMHLSSNLVVLLLRMYPKEINISVDKDR